MERNKSGRKGSVPTDFTYVLSSILFRFHFLSFILLLAHLSHNYYAIGTQTMNFINIATAKQKQIISPMPPLLCVIVFVRLCIPVHCYRDKHASHHQGAPSASVPRHPVGGRGGYSLRHVASEIIRFFTESANTRHARLLRTPAFCVARTT